MPKIFLFFSVILKVFLAVRLNKNSTWTQLTHLKFINYYFEAFYLSLWPSLVNFTVLCQQISPLSPFFLLEGIDKPSGVDLGKCRTVCCLSCGDVGYEGRWCRWSLMLKAQHHFPQQLWAWTQGSTALRKGLGPGPASSRCSCSWELNHPRPQGRFDPPPMAPYRLDFLKWVVFSADNCYPAMNSIFFSALLLIYPFVCFQCYLSRVLDKTEGTYM